MKLFLLAAAAVIATPALAQTTTPDNVGQPSSAQGTSSPNGTVPSANSGSANPASNPAANANADAGAQNMPMPAQTTAGSMPMSTGATPAGGYQPSTPAMSGPPMAGQTVTYQQAPSPDQAYPAPAPLAHYPICKAGQYDQCMQASSAHKMRRKHK